MGNDAVEMVVSPFERTLETAQHIYYQLAAQVRHVKVEPLIREQEFGNLQGDEFQVYTSLLYPYISTFSTRFVCHHRDCHYSTSHSLSLSKLVCTIASNGPYFSGPSPPHRCACC